MRWPCFLLLASLPLASAATAQTTGSASSPKSLKFDVAQVPATRDSFVFRLRGQERGWAVWQYEIRPLEMTQEVVYTAASEFRPVEEERLRVVVNRLTGQPISTFHHIDLFSPGSDTVMVEHDLEVKRGEISGRRRGGTRSGGVIIVPVSRPFASGTVLSDYGFLAAAVSNAVPGDWRRVRSRAARPSRPDLLRSVHASQRPVRHLLGGSLDADRVGGRVVQHRLAQRAAGALGLRAPVRAHDVRGLGPREEGRALPADLAGRRVGERQYGGRPHQLLRDAALESLEPGPLARGRPHALARHHGRALSEPAGDGEGGAPPAGRQPAVLAGLHRRHDLAVRQRRVLRLRAHGHRVDG